MDLIAYWNVVKRQQRVMVIGLCAAAALALIALVKPNASGLSWRTPPVYQATTTLLVTQPGFPEGRSTIDEYQQAEGPERLASFYALLAESDRIKRAVSRRFDLDEANYEVAPLPGADGRPLPFIKISAFQTSPEGAVALANGISNALRTYLAREQGNNEISGKERVELQVVEAAEDAEVFQGVRLTPSIMLFLLVALVTLAVAFVVDNLRGGRQPLQVQTPVGGEPRVSLGIVSDDRDDPQATDAEPVPNVSVRIQPSSEQTEEVIAETSPQRGRWAAPS